MNLPNVNQLMSGKKKISASFVVPLVVSVINAIVADPETADSLGQLVTQYVPTIIAWLGGWFYTANEAAVDKERAKIEVEKEKTAQEAIKHEPAIPEPAPAPVDLKALVQRVEIEVRTDDDGIPDIVDFYQELQEEGHNVKANTLDDVIRYTRLVVNAAHNKFELLNKIRLDDPDLAQKLLTIGKCPYKSVDAYVSYEGNEKALLDVRENEAQLAALEVLARADINETWRGFYDQSLYGLMEGSEWLVKRLSAAKE